MNSDQSATLDNSPAFGLFDWILGIAGCLILFGPLAAIFFFYAVPDTTTVNVSTETVGIAVIMRATLQRLFRSGSRSMLQTAMGTVTRASARTMTRRVVRVGVKSLMMYFRGSAATSDQVRDDESEQSTATATVVGFVTVGLSLLGVLLLLDIERLPGSETPSRLEPVLGGLSLPMAVTLGAAPLLIYVALLAWAAPWCGAGVRFRTGWESILLQAYFTGSGSYLPLATDSEMSGPPEARAKLALVSLGGLFALHVACAAAGAAMQSYALEYLGGMFLLYCFVFSFPIKPLDGYYLWARSRWLWLLIWIPILASFVWALPESLHAIV